jgi:hypothetical protein
MKLSGQSIVSLVAGFCLLGLIVTLKNVLMVPAESLVQDTVVYIIIYVGFITSFSLKNESTKKFKYDTPLFWSMFLVLITLAIIALYALSNAPDLTEPEAVSILKIRYTEFKDYPNEGLPPQSIRTEKAAGGWYVAFIQEGSGRPIISAKCYFIDNMRSITGSGVYVPAVGEDSFGDFSAKACSPSSRCGSGNCPGFLEGKVTIGPLCPVERVPPEPACQPTEETYENWPVAVWAADKKTRVAQIEPNLNGAYRIELPAGNYVVDLEGQQPSMIGGSNLPAMIKIDSGETTVLDIDIDTGIR